MAGRYNSTQLIVRLGVVGLASISCGDSTKTEFFIEQYVYPSQINLECGNSSTNFGHSHGKIVQIDSTTYEIVPCTAETKYTNTLQRK